MPSTLNIRDCFEITTPSGTKIKAFGRGRVVRVEQDPKNSNSQIIGIKYDDSSIGDHYIGSKEVI